VSTERKIARFSITELADAQRCLRSWDIQSANRQSLMKRGESATALWLGSALHRGLGAQIDGEHPKEAYWAYITSEKERIAKDYTDRTGGVQMWDSEWARFDEQALFGEQLLKRYFQWYGMKETYKHEGVLYRPIASELTFQIALHEIPGFNCGIYDEVWLVGTIDVAFLDDLDHLCIGDHKSYSQKVNDEEMQRDSQFVGYSACLSYLVGALVSKFMYNGINKKLPTEPKVLTGAGPTKGRVSKANDIVTDVGTYLRAIVRNGEDPHDPYYADHIANLREKALLNNPFFYRRVFRVTEHQMKDWWENMLKITQRLASDPPIEFNRPWTGCWDCNVQDICNTMTDGGSVDAIIRERYEVGTYGTQNTLMNTVTRQTVRSIADLIEFAARKAQV